LAFKEEVV
jgi:hypothetical protein